MQNRIGTYKSLQKYLPSARLRFWRKPFNFLHREGKAKSKEVVLNPIRLAAVSNAQNQNHQPVVFNLINDPIFTGPNPKHIFRSGNYFSRPRLIRVFFKGFDFNPQLGFYFSWKFIKGFFGGFFKNNGIIRRQYPIPFLCPPRKLPRFLLGFSQFQTRQQHRRDTRPGVFQRFGSWVYSITRRLNGGRAAYFPVIAMWWWMQT